MRSSRALAAVLTGTGVGQLALVAATPLLSRLYTAQDLAMLSVIIGLAVPIGMVSTLRWDAAVPIPTDEPDVARLVTLGLVSVAGVTVLVGVLAGLLGPTVASALSVDAGVFRAALPLVVAGTGITQLLTQLAVRRGSFGATARSKAGQAIATAVAQVGFPGLRVAGAPGLVAGYVVGLTAGVALLLRGLSVGGHGTALLRPDRRVLRRFARFPLFLVPSTLVNAVGLQLPVLLVAASFPSAVTGQFAMAVRVIGIPATVVGLAVAQVFLGTLAETVRTAGRDALGAFDRASAYMLALGVLVAAVVVVAGPDLFALVLGERWRHSGDIARHLALMVAAQLVASPLASTLTVLERPGLQFLLDAMRIVGITCVFGVLAGRGAGIEETALALSVVSTLFYTAYWATSRHLLVQHARRVTTG